MWLGVGHVITSCSMRIWNLLAVHSWYVLIKYIQRKLSKDGFRCECPSACGRGRGTDERLNSRRRKIGLWANSSPSTPKLLVFQLPGSPLTVLVPDVYPRCSIWNSCLPSISVPGSSLACLPAPFLFFRWTCWNKQLPPGVTLCSKWAQFCSCFKAEVMEVAWRRLFLTESI